MKLLLVGLRSAIEPLGIMHLAGVARDAGWECDVCLVSDRDYEPAIAQAREDKPDIVGISVWTGSHRQALAAAAALRDEGMRVAVGGPHATYFASDCARHATWTIVGSGFRLLRDILARRVEPGTHVDPVRPDGVFPHPDRSVVYRRYPDLAQSPIKSIMASAGCPFRCTYCYNAGLHALYGGYRPQLRTVDAVLAEGRELAERWPAQLVFMSDDLFGADIKWLEEFSRRWPSEVGTPWHCQIRLELTRDERRLDLFQAGGCTGVTLAVESAIPFLRRFILNRNMPDELIESGIRRIIGRRLTVRTEQMLGVPFSDVAADLATLALNVRLAPDMAWASILAPYRGTEIGEMAAECGLYAGSNDDLAASFFDSSVLRHVRRGWRDIEELVVRSVRGPRDNPMCRLRMCTTDRSRATLGLHQGGHTTIEYLSPAENSRACSQIRALQRIFPWAARLPAGSRIAARWLDHGSSERTWRRLGQLIEDTAGGPAATEAARVRLAEDMACDDLHHALAENPWYCATLPAGGDLARTLVERGTLDKPDPWDEIARLTRVHLFEAVLYRIRPSRAPVVELPSC